MHTNLLTVLFLLSCIQVFAARELTGSVAKSLLQETSTASVTVSADASGTSGTGNSASVSGSATVVGPGSVVVEAQAADFDITQARDQFAEALANAIAVDVPRIDEISDVLAIADAVVRPFSEAIVEAFTQATSVRIITTGEGASACGQATISPEAAARETAQTLVDVLSQSSDRISFVSPSDAVNAIVSVTVGFFQSSQTEICANFPSPASNFVLGIDIVYREVTLLALALSNPSTVNDPIVVTVSGAGILATTVNGENFVDVLDPVLITAQPFIAAFDG